MKTKPANGAKVLLAGFFHAMNVTLAEAGKSGRGAKSAGSGETPRRGRAMRFAQQNAFAVRRSRTAAPTGEAARLPRPAKPVGARARAPGNFCRSAPKREGSSILCAAAFVGAGDKRGLQKPPCRYRSKRQSSSRPSVETVTTRHGMNFPLCWSALFTAFSIPPQHGTSMRTTATLLMSFSAMIWASFSV